MNIKKFKLTIICFIMISLISCNEKGKTIENSLTESGLFGKISWISEINYCISEKFGEVNKSNLTPHQLNSTFG